MAEKLKFFKFIIMLLTAMTFLAAIGISALAATGKESVKSENLNLELNESGTYEWQLKNPGTMTALKASGSVSSNGTARVYIEKNGTRQLVFDSTKQLFDVDIHVLPESKKIFQGDDVLIQILLFNLRGFGSGDISVSYSIQDANENIIATQEEKVFVQTQAKFVRKLALPLEVKPDTYTAFVEASSNTTIVGTGSDTFEVAVKYPPKYPVELKTYLIGLGIAGAFIVVLIISIYGYRALKKKRKIEEFKEKKPLEKKEKLEKELKALDEARKSGFISEASYRKEKKRLEERLALVKR